MMTRSLVRGCKWLAQYSLILLPSVIALWLQFHSRDLRWILLAVGMAQAVKLMRFLEPSKRLDPVCGVCAASKTAPDDLCVACGSRCDSSFEDTMDGLGGLQWTFGIPLLATICWSVGLAFLLPNGFALTEKQYLKFIPSIMMVEWLFTALVMLVLLAEHIGGGAGRVFARQLTTSTHMGEVRFRQEFSLIGVTQPASVTVTRDVYQKRSLQESKDNPEIRALASWFVELEHDKLLQLYTVEQWNTDRARGPEVLMFKLQSNRVMSAKHPLALLHSILVDVCCRDGSGEASLAEVMHELVANPWVIHALAPRGETDWNESGRRGVALCASFIQRAVALEPASLPLQLTAKKPGLPALSAVH